MNEDRMDTGSMRRREFLALGGASLAASALRVPTLEGAERGRQDAVAVDALTFDVFGTVVDWYTSIIREGEMLAREKGFDVDWGLFATRWRSGYGPAMNRVRRGELPWTTIDELHRMNLEELIVEFGLTGLTEGEVDHLNRVWHRLVPWPDTLRGLHRLRSRHLISTLSNGNVSLLTNMARNAGLPWDCVLSAELVKQYKTDPAVYEMAVDLLDLPPERIMMVAAHKGDLRAAQRVGLRTAFVARPLEYGPGRDVDDSPDPDFDYNAMDFLDLAAQLGV